MVWFKSNLSVNASFSSSKNIQSEKRKRVGDRKTHFNQENVEGKAKIDIRLKLCLLIIDIKKSYEAVFKKKLYRILKFSIPIFDNKFGI